MFQEMSVFVTRDKISQQPTLEKSLFVLKRNYKLVILFLDEVPFWFFVSKLVPLPQHAY
jgi:hypothetical protein